MKKLFSFTLLLAVVVALLLCAPVCQTAFAEESVVVTYVYDGKEKSMIAVEKGSVLQAPPSYTTLTNMGISDLEGKSISLKLETEDGETVVYPYTFQSDVTFCIILTPTEEKVTYSYIYDYVSADNYQIYTRPLTVGTKIDLSAKIGNYNISAFYSDPGLKNQVVPDLIAEQDATYYVALNKTVSFTLNGTAYTAQYGESVRKVTKTDTHAVPTFFLDEGMTVRYETGLAIDDIVLYGTYVRTHYAVTFVNKDQKVVKYFPINSDGTATVGEDDFPTESNIAAPEWRIDEKKAPEYPYIISDDTTLYASNGMVYPLTKSDRAWLHPLGFALLLMAIWGGVYEHRKKKKQKAQQNAQNDVPSDEKDDQKPSDEKDAPVEEQTDSVSNKDNE